MIASVLLALAAAAAVQTAPTPPATGAAAAPDVPAGPLYILEHIQTSKLPDAMMEKIKPLNTLQEIEAILKLNGVPFAWRMAGMPVRQTPTELIKQIDALKPGDVFVIPEGERLNFYVLRAKRP